MAKKAVKKDFFERYGLNRSYVSLVLGILVVVIIGIAGLALIRGGDGLKNVSLKDILTGQQDKAPQTETSEKIHVVKEGENLWTISESLYKSGYNWVDIAKENNLESPDAISAGQTLKIPENVEIINPTGEIASRIETGSYQVREGDNLWEISVRAYGDGYKWVEVARANNLANPDLLFVGTELILPR